MPAHPALTRAVNAAIARGEPIVFEVPADIVNTPTLAILPNGGHVKARRPLPDKRHCVAAEIVLCHLPHNTATPFATWQRNTAESVGCYWGHYFEDSKSALADYATRGQ